MNTVTDFRGRVNRGTRMDGRSGFLRPRVEPCAAPVTVVAVTSPLKTLTVPTCVVELAVADVPEFVAADALIGPVVTTEPSAGYEKLEPNAA